MAQIYQVTGGELDGSVMEGPPWYEKLPFRASNGYVFNGSEWRWDVEEAKAVAEAVPDDAAASVVEGMKPETPP